MKWTFVSCLGLMAIAHAAPSTDSGCSADHAEKFEVTASPLVSKRDLQRRGCGDPSALVLTLKSGNLKDAHNRVGYIASNKQFQFDDAPQPDAVATSGFSLCSNNSLALQGSTVFYQCLSGNFYNLYSMNDAKQCEPVRMVATPCDSGSNPAAPAVSQIADGQPQAPTSNGPVTQIADGQPQAPAPTGKSGGSGSPASQISDGQVQVAAPSGQAGTGSSGSEASSPGQARPASEGSAEAGETKPASDESAGSGESQNPVPTGSVMSPPVTDVATGSSQASNASESSSAGSSASSAAGGGSNASPTSPAAPSKGALQSGGFKALPGATAALVLALFSIVAI